MSLDKLQQCGQYCQCLQLLPRWQAVQSCQPHGLTIKNRMPTDPLTSTLSAAAMATDPTAEVSRRRRSLGRNRTLGLKRLRMRSVRSVARKSWMTNSLEPCHGPPPHPQREINRPASAGDQPKLVCFPPQLPLPVIPARRCELSAYFCPAPEAGGDMASRQGWTVLTNWGGNLFSHFLTSAGLPELQVACIAAAHKRSGSGQAGLEYSRLLPLSNRSRDVSGSYPLGIVAIRCHALGTDANYPCKARDRPATPSSSRFQRSSGVAMRGNSEKPQMHFGRSDPAGGLATL